MQTFAKAQDAKEFLVARIVSEAAREGVPLSETERKMLYFSETAWTLPDILEVNGAFERECDQAEYEEKIGALARSFREWAGKANLSQHEAWDEAIRVIGAEDHYLLVLLSARKRSMDSPLVDRLKLVALAFLIVVALLVGQFFLRKR